ncbi:hypothetical protein [Altibacter sp. HG106]|uniref:hypothetical protein n=1 Tax=Altibacter sp. HG106 TaxID=3023937 RepID=UPI002350ACC6|nr:hypothetical protein [Altibacter sp. HG106]MDC7995465.1 hypothetical protein [Altibacter sp. HG106]
MKRFILLLNVFCVLSLYAQDCQIPNGNFEQWKNNDKAVDWAGSNIAGKEGGASAMAGYDFRNTFRVPGKVGYGLQIKNVSIADFLAEKKPADWARMPEQYKQMIRESAFSGYVFTCEGNCEDAILAQNQAALMKDLFFPITPTFGALCGYYKANFKKGDKAWINTFVTTRNPEQVAGGVRPGEASAVIFKNTATWTPFKIPIYFFEGLEPSQMFIQLYLVGKGFPNGQPTGMNPVQLAMEFKSSDGSEVFFDELCLCDSPSYVDTSDPAFADFEIPDSTPADNDDDATNSDETIYIATTGSDGNSGTAADPFATLKKALAVAQAKRVKGSSVTIIIKDGIYRQETIMDLKVTANLPTLRIQAENAHQAVFEGMESIASNVTFTELGAGIYRSNGPLHPNQKPILDYSDPTTFSDPTKARVPALLVNGVQFSPSQMIQQTPNSYMVSPQMIMVNPSGTSLNSASVKVSVRDYALNVGDGGNVIVSGLRIKGYPVPQYSEAVPNATPGLKGVVARNCKFE